MPGIDQVLRTFRLLSKSNERTLFPRAVQQARRAENTREAAGPILPAEYSTGLASAATTHLRVGQMRKPRLKAGEEMCPRVPSWKGVLTPDAGPASRLGALHFTVRGLILCCCHLEILDNSGTRDPGFHFANTEPDLPRSNLTPKLSFLTLPVHISCS